MSRVCVIAISPQPAPGATDRLESIRSRLERAGHSVEVDEARVDLAAARPVGLVWLMVDRLRSASADYLVVVDLGMGYRADDVAAVVGCLVAGPAGLVVAARRGRWFGPVARRLVGTADPTSGLVGLTLAAARAADRSFAPVGSRFTCELLARVEGARGAVAIEPIAGPRRRWVPMDDIRHAKRIADERLGNLSRLLQFCFVGASGMIVDLTTYAALQAALSRTPLASRVLFRPGAGGSPMSLAVGVAAVLAIATAMTWNFSLNRRLTFNDARGGSIVRQFVRYTLSNLIGIAVSLSFRLLLPTTVPFFARHRLAAAVAGIVAATGISFSMSRWFVFDAQPRRVDDRPGHPADDARPDRRQPDGDLASTR